MNKTAMAAQEKQWQAEGDLRTLIEAEKIKRDKTRYNAAMKKKVEMSKDLANVGGKDK